VTLFKSIGGTHEINVHNAQDNVVRLVADLSSAIGDEVALPQMAQAELEKSNVFTRSTATDARSRRVVPLFHCSRYDLLRVSRPFPSTQSVDTGLVVWWCSTQSQS
jgi:hypothetical protein